MQRFRLTLFIIFNLVITSLGLIWLYETDYVFTFNETINPFFNEFWRLFHKQFYINAGILLILGWFIYSCFTWHID